VAFRIRDADRFGKEVRRVARKQIEGALAVVRGGDHVDPETVHELRKRCKKLRAVLRLVRPALGDDVYTVENARVRDMAHWLSPLLDAHTAVVAYDALLDRYDGEVHRRQFATVRRRLVQAEGHCTSDSSDLEDRYAQVRAEMEAARHRIDDWSVGDLGAETWREGFVQTYRRARKAMSAAYDDPTPEGDGPAIGVLRRLIDRRRDELEVLARPTGMRLFAEKPRRIGALHVRYWSAWSEEQRCRPAQDDGQAAASA
jgi:hypothetical protein